MGIPFAGYKDFESCVRQNQQADDPEAYCGYIKHQVEGGKKKEEALSECPGCHEAYHLEEGIRKLEEEVRVYDKEGKPYDWEKGKLTPAKEPESGKGEEGEAKRLEEEIKRLEEECSAREVMNLALKGEDDGAEIRRLEEEIAKLEAEPPSAGQLGRVRELATKDKPTPHDVGEHSALQKKFYPGLGTEGPSALLTEASAFVESLKATLDEVTLMAKDQGWASTSGVSDKVAPGSPTYKFPVDGKNVEVAVDQTKGFQVAVGWFNTVMEKLKEIVGDTDKFLVEAGWNSQEVVDQYAEHKKHWGKDYTAGT
jgi:hypothetical protein